MSVRRNELAQRSPEHDLGSERELCLATTKVKTRGYTGNWMGLDEDCANTKTATAVTRVIFVHQSTSIRHTNFPHDCTAYGPL